MNNPKIIIGIESSCDETSVSICQKGQEGVQILSNVVASSAALQAKYGGVIPEQAAREQLSSIIPVTMEALEKAGLNPADIDAIAVTVGPGLIGSLLIGVETAKVLSIIWNKPLIPINHLLGHFYANFIGNEIPHFPCLGLLVSGGHTDLVLFSNHGKYKYLGGTRDDAAGECFDKCARLLGLPYPGGPNLSKLAEGGNPKAYPLPRPMLNSKDLDFSFSGLKTAVLNIVNDNAGDAEERSRASTAVSLLAHEDAPEIPTAKDPRFRENLAASIEAAITDVLVEKTVTAAQTYKVEQVMVAGGVAANKTLAKKLTQRLSELIPHAKVFIPTPQLSTDNAASIATAAFFNYHPTPPLEVQADPNLSLDNHIDQP